MDHSCGRCGASLAGAAERYVLSIALTPGAAGAPADGDPVRATAELLEELESGEYPATPHRAEYDLCRACRDRYAADPLGKSLGRHPRFSRN